MHLVLADQHCIGVLKVTSTQCTRRCLITTAVMLGIVPSVTSTQRILACCRIASALALGMLAPEAGPKCVWHCLVTCVLVLEGVAVCRHALQSDLVFDCDLC